MMMASGSPAGGGGGGTGGKFPRRRRPLDKSRLVHSLTHSGSLSLALRGCKMDGRIEGNAGRRTGCDSYAASRTGSSAHKIVSASHVLTNRRKKENKLYL